MHLKLIKYFLVISLITCCCNSGISQNVYHWFPSGSGTTNNLNSTSGRFCAGNGGVILYTSNSGLNWVLQNSGTSLNLFSISYFSNNVIASGQGGLILHSSNLGENWTQVNSGTSNTIYGVTRAFLSSCMAVGAGGTILYTSNSGLNWVSQSSGTTSDLYDVYALAYWAWAAGNSGTLVLTTNTGENWIVKNTGTNSDLKSVHFYNLTTGWAVGSYGTIIKSTDGGNNWFSQFSGTSANLNDIYMSGANFGWICGSGGNLLKTTNGGLNWVVQPAFTSVTLNSIYGFDNAIAVGNGGTIFVRRIDTLYFPRIVFQPNNIRTMFENTGIFNQDLTVQNHPGFQWPAGSNKFAIFTSGLTIAATINGDLRMAAASYTGEYTPGYIADSSGYKVGKWDDRFRFYCIKRGDGPNSTDWANWGLMVPFGAPYIDVNHNNTYEPAVDTPGIRGAVQTLFICLTDGFTGTHSTGEGFGGGTPPLYAEVHMTAWGYDNPGYQDIQFIKWDIINKNSLPWNNTYFAIVNDPDLGYSNDDYIGCDTIRNLGYCYNGDNYDNENQPYSYGYDPPAVGIRLLNCIGNYDMSLKAFTYFICTGCPAPFCETSPNGETEGAYNLMKGIKKDGTPWVIPNTNPPQTTKFCYSGDPETNTGWTEFGGKIWNCNHQLTGQLEIPVPPGDRRMTLSTGSENFTVNPGDTNKVLIAQMIARGTNYLNSVTLLKQLSDVAQRLCDSGFVIGIKQISTQVPGTFKLYQNYPNPFNPVTNIKYEVPFKTKVTIKIYDVNGREVSVLVNEVQNAGSYNVDWDGESYASGVYFYKLEAEGFLKAYKMVLIK